MKGKEKKDPLTFFSAFFFSFLFLKRVQLLRQKVSGGNETGANNVSLVKQVLKGPGGWCEPPPSAAGMFPSG